MEIERLRNEDIPLARFQALFANANRDSKTKPFSAEDFHTYRASSTTTSDQLSSTTAAALLSLRADDHLHPLLFSCWAEVLKAATEHEALPEVRALVSDDEQVWVVAPQFEGKNIRGLVCVSDYLHGDILLRDIDRKLMTYRVQIPKRPDAAAGWIEAGHLLAPAT